MTRIKPGKTGKAKGISTYNKLDKDDLLKVIDVEKEAALASVFYSKEYIPTCIKTSKLYFAGPWFTEKSAAFYDAVLTISNNCNLFSEYKTFYPRCQVNKKPFDAFVKNVSNIQDADMVVAFVDEKDVGTAWEIGMAYSLGKKVILLGLDETTFLSHTNVMLAFTGSCTTLRELGKLLVGKEYKTIEIKNEWEGIE